MTMTQALDGALETSYWQGAIYDSMVEFVNCTGDNNFTCLSHAPHETVFYAGTNLTQTLSPYETWSTNHVTDGRIFLAPPSKAP